MHHARCHILPPPPTHTLLLAPSPRCILMPVRTISSSSCSPCVPSAAKECSDLWTPLPPLGGGLARWRCHKQWQGEGAGVCVCCECNLCAAHMELALVLVADAADAFCFVFLFMDFHWLAATPAATARHRRRRRRRRRVKTQMIY